jgi:hypothetical protein
MALFGSKQLGLGRVPCVRIEHLSETEQRVLRLAVNRLGEKGEWNLDELKIEFEELIFADAPVKVSGFALDEIDHIVLGEGDEAIEEGPLAPEAGAIAVARVGDVFNLGPHRIICGSSIDPETLRRLTAGDPPERLVPTDEPYNVPIAGHVTGGRHREFAMASGEMTDAEFLAFNEAWMAAVLPCLRDGGVFGSFIDWRGYPTVHSAAIKTRPQAHQSGRLDEDQCRHGQPLPLPTRAPAPVQERLRSAREQYRARQARALALERLDLPRRLLDRLGRTTWA